MGTSRRIKIQIPDTHLRAIGLIAITWSQLENAIERIIWRVGNLDDNRGQAITTHMSMKARLDAACAITLLEFPTSSGLMALQGLRKKINGSLANKRNKAIHNRMFRGLDPDIPVRADRTARGELKIELKALRPGELEKIADQLNESVVEARDIISALYPLIQNRNATRLP